MVGIIKHIFSFRSEPGMEDRGMDSAPSAGGPAECDAAVTCQQTCRQSKSRLQRARVWSMHAYMIHDVLHIRMVLLYVMTDGEGALRRELIE